MHPISPLALVMKCTFYVHGKTAQICRVWPDGQLLSRAVEHLNSLITSLVEGDCEPILAELQTDINELGDLSKTAGELKILRSELLEYYTPATSAHSGNFPAIRLRSSASPPTA